jgi:hypothetical protein
MDASEAKRLLLESENHKPKNVEGASTGLEPALGKETMQVEILGEAVGDPAPENCS